MIVCNGNIHIGAFILLSLVHVFTSICWYAILLLFLFVALYSSFFFPPHTKYSMYCIYVHDCCYCCCCCWNYIYVFFSFFHECFNIYIFFFIAHRANAKSYVAFVFLSFLYLFLHSCMCFLSRMSVMYVYTMCYVWFGQWITQTFSLLESCVLLTTLEPIDWYTQIVESVVYIVIVCWYQKNTKFHCWILRNISTFLLLLL